jgi:hypothetical protein
MVVSKPSTKLSAGLNLGMIVEEISSPTGQQRIGEIVSVFGDRNKKFQVLELNRHDLSPFFSNSKDKLKFFNVHSDNCRKLDLSRIRKPNSFLPGDVVRHSKNGRVRFGIIIGFTHPEGLYSESIEKGYNGKDLVECVEISGRAGLPQKIDSMGKVKRFTVGPSDLKICEVLPMDKNGGTRIKDYWELRKEHVC